MSRIGSAAHGGQNRAPSIRTWLIPLKHSCYGALARCAPHGAWAVLAVASVLQRLLVPTVHQLCQCVACQNRSEVIVLHMCQYAWLGAFLKLRASARQGLSPPLNRACMEGCAGRKRVPCSSFGTQECLASSITIIHQAVCLHQGYESLDKAVSGLLVVMVQATCTAFFAPLTSNLPQIWSCWWD